MCVLVCVVRSSIETARTIYGRVFKYFYQIERAFDLTENKTTTKNEKNKNKCSTMKGNTTEKHGEKSQRKYLQWKWNHGWCIVQRWRNDETQNCVIGSDSFTYWLVLIGRESGQWFDMPSKAQVKMINWGDFLRSLSCHVYG